MSGSISRRTALRAGAAAGAAGVSMTVGAAGPVRATQEATPTGMRSEHLEVDYTPVDPVTITVPAVARRSGAIILC